MRKLLKNLIEISPYQNQKQLSQIINWSNRQILRIALNHYKSFNNQKCRLIKWNQKLWPILSNSVHYSSRIFDTCKNVIQIFSPGWISRQGKNRQDPDVFIQNHINRRKTIQLCQCSTCVCSLEQTNQPHLLDKNKRFEIDQFNWKKKLKDQNLQKLCQCICEALNSKIGLIKINVKQQLTAFDEIKACQTIFQIRRQFITPEPQQMQKSKISFGHQIQNPSKQMSGIKFIRIYINTRAVNTIYSRKTEGTNGHNNQNKKVPLKPMYKILCKRKQVNKQFAKAIQKYDSYLNMLFFLIVRRRINNSNKSLTNLTKYFNIFLSKIDSIIKLISTI